VPIISTISVNARLQVPRNNSFQFFFKIKREIEKKKQLSVSATKNQNISSASKQKQTTKEDMIQEDADP